MYSSFSSVILSDILERLFLLTKILAVNKKKTIINVKNESGTERSLTSYHWGVGGAWILWGGVVSLLAVFLTSPVVPGLLVGFICWATIIILGVGVVHGPTIVRIFWISVNHGSTHFVTYKIKSSLILIPSNTIKVIKGDFFVVRPVAKIAEKI